MKKQADHLYLKQTPEIQECLLALRSIILNYDARFTAQWKYGMPFLQCNGKTFCYLWVNKNRQQPYIGFLNGVKIKHPSLIQEKRVNVKIFLIDADKDIPIRTLQSILKKALAVHKS
jgi:hypothetical protein